ncbi:MAG: hypothetical protein ACTS9Y_05270 [Methylophilus sp.]|uniref:hypothetical protein n=1 Tax=Methylophilus sp. TaxID=29541 RepID=UPI003F9F6264
MEFTFIQNIAKQVWILLISDSTSKLLSLVGTVVSIYVGYTVRDIKKGALFKLRAPDLCDALKNHSTQINNLLHDCDKNLDQIRTEVSLSIEVLKNLRSKISGQAKATVKESIKKLEKFLKKGTSNTSRDMVREAYTELLVSHRSVTNEIDDRRVLP